MKNKNIILFLSATAFLAGCNRNTSENNSNSLSADSAAYSQGAPDTSKHTMENVDREIAMYREKISMKLDEMKADIEAAKAKRKAEKDLKKQKEYDAQIDNWEKDRQTLNEKLDRMGDKANLKWDEFKKEVDDFFEKDKVNRNDPAYQR